jgi:hypothetical protein
MDGLIAFALTEKYVGKVLVTIMERVNVKMLMTAFCFNLHLLKTLKHKGIIQASGCYIKTRKK